MHSIAAEAPVTPQEAQTYPARLTLPRQSAPLRSILPTARKATRQGQGRHVARGTR